MNMRKNLFSAFAVGSILVGQIAVVLGQTGPPTWPVVEGSFFGLHSLAAGRTARLNVVNTVLGSPPEPDNNYCRVTMIFDIYERAAADGSVRPLRLLRRISRRATLAPGEGISFDLPAQAADGSVLVATSVFLSPSYNGGPFELTSTLEIRQGGRTLLVLPAVRKSFDPQPEPPV